MTKCHRIALVLALAMTGCNAIDGWRGRGTLPSETPFERGRFRPEKEPAPVPIESPRRGRLDGPPVNGVPLKESKATTNAAMAAGLVRDSASDLRIPKEERRRSDSPPASPPDGIVRSVEEGQKRAEQWGAISPQLKQIDGGEWQFSCLVPNPKNVNVHRRYEARDRDQLTAVKLVLDQIEQDR